MPFFFVRGNHDINMPPTRKVWAERRGPRYYHFIYKNVLFVVLDTEDAQRPIPPHMEQDLAKYNRLKTEDPKKAMAFMIEWMETPEAQAAFGQATQIQFPAKQVEWFQQVIKSNPNVRWTFVFLHEPVWNNPSESFRNINAAIQGRNCTFFAGHAHYYDYDLLDGHEYITVASAGAAFTRAGPGNVDHLTWVTMTPQGPEIAGIALKGIFDRRGLDPKMFGAYDRTPPQVPDLGLIRAAPVASLGMKSMPNLRDLGGYRTVDGKTVLKGLIYRANQPYNLQEEDLEKLKELGLKSAFDLRTYDERKSCPGELPSAVNYVWLDVLGSSPQSGPALLEKLLADPQTANAQLGDGKVEQLFTAAYRDLVSLPSAKLEFRKLFLSLTDKSQLPALIHCTTGKDRTGWAAAALLTLLGVPRETVLNDYLRSNEYILPLVSERIDKFEAAGGDRRIPAAIFGVRPEYLQASLDEVKNRYGSIENYFSEGLGIDAEQQQSLKDLYLEALTLSGTAVDVDQ